MEMLSSVQNALRLIRQFSPDEPELGVNELSRRMHLPKSTVSRLLGTLHAEGFVAHVGARGYRLSLRMHDLGTMALRHERLREAASPELLRLRNQTGETSHLSILDHTDAVCIAYLAADGMWQTFTHAGSRMAAHASSSGKVLLAYADEMLVDAAIAAGLAPLTPHTIVDPQVFREALQQVRADGFAVSRDEAVIGHVGIAAPIFDEKAKAVGALSIVTQRARCSAAVAAQHIALLLDAGRTVSRNLGFTE
jgi:DNA-binding IclR family transcriptional regulator